MNGTWRRVIVGWDGSPEAQRALERVAASAPTAHVVLATVSDPDLAWVRHVRAVDVGGLLAEGRRQAEELGLSPSLCALYGETGEELSRLAQEEEADAVVVGAHHHAVMLRMFGSVGVDLALRVPCDVLIAA